MKSTIFLLMLFVVIINVFAHNPQGAPQGPPPGFFKANPANWENPTGPYKVVMEVDKTLPDHTIYRPVNLKISYNTKRLNTTSDLMGNRDLKQPGKRPKMD